MCRRAGQRDQTFKGVPAAFRVCGRQTAMARISGPDKFKGFITDNFSDTVGIQRHGQAIGDQIAQGHRPPPFIAAADPLHQTAWLFRINFAVAFGDQHPFQQRHGLEHRPQQSCFSGSALAADDNGLIRPADGFQQGHCIGRKHLQVGELAEGPGDRPVFPYAERRYRRTAWRDGDIDAQAIPLISYPAMTVIVVNQSTLTDNQEPAEGVVGSRIVKPDGYNLTDTPALDSEFGRTGSIDVGNVRILHILLERPVSEQEIHDLLAQFSGIVAGAQTLLIGRFLDQVLQNRAVCLP